MFTKHYILIRRWCVKWRYQLLMNTLSYSSIRNCLGCCCRQSFSIRKQLWIPMCITKLYDLCTASSARLSYSNTLIRLLNLYLNLLARRSIFPSRRESLAFASRLRILRYFYFVAVIVVVVMQATHAELSISRRGQRSGQPLPGPSLSLSFSHHF